MDTLEQGSNASALNTDSSQPIDNNPSGADAPGAGEFSDAMMERPAYIPEKFFKDGKINIKALAESYGELERGRSQSTQQPGKSETPPANASANDSASKGNTPAEAPKTDGQNSQAPQIVIPGINQVAMAHYTQELKESGKLSDASYADLAKIGYPKAVVDSYVKGMQTDALVNQAVADARIADAEITSITNSIGGQQVLSEMLGWATNNLSDADLKVYNEAVSQSDPAKVRMAVNGLYHAFKQAQGPDLIGGRPAASTSSVEPFASNDEVVAAMENPKYDRDPEYRRQVEARIAVSNVFGQSREYKTRDSY